MKGVCAPGHAARRDMPEEGAASLRSPSFVVICLCLLQIPSVICDNIKLHVLQGTHVCV